MFFLLVLLGCEAEKIEPCTSSQEAQTGLYQIETETVDGNCGSIGDLEAEVINGIVQVDESIGCSLTSERWEQDTCTTHSVQDCDDGVWTMNMRWEVIGSGDLSGRLQAYMLDIYGYECQGLWSFEAEKIDVVLEDTGI